MYLPSLSWTRASEAEEELKSWLFGSAPSIPLPPRYYTHPASRWSANQNSPPAPSVRHLFSPIVIKWVMLIAGFQTPRSTLTHIQRQDHYLKLAGKGPSHTTFAWMWGPSRAKSLNILLSPSNHIHQKLRTDIINESTSRRERGAPQQPMSRSALSSFCRDAIGGPRSDRAIFPSKPLKRRGSLSLCDRWALINRF